MDLASSTSSRTSSVLRRVPAAEFWHRLAKLSAVDTAKLSEHQAAERVGRAASGYITKSVIIGTNGTFRARKGPMEGLFENVSELWTPPVDAISDRGRFNAAGERRFYCSSELEACLFEMRPRPGDRITILVAGAKVRGQQIPLAHMGLHKANVGSEVTGWMAGGLRENNEFLRWLERMNVLKRWIALDDYFSTVATTPFPPATELDDYKMSLASARFLLRAPEFEGLLYPSVALKYAAFNLCLYPEVADRIFFPFEAWAVDIIEASTLGDGSQALSMMFTHRSHSIAPSGEIAWSSRLSDNSPAEALTSLRRAGDQVQRA